jgi:hypothetical protein
MPFLLKSPSTVDGCFPGDCPKRQHSLEVFLSLIALINRTNSSKASLCIVTDIASSVKLKFIGVLMMGYRAFFQMDQAVSKNKEILWYFRECSQDSGLDSSLCLCPRCHNEKTSQPPGESLHNFTNFKCISFRKDRTLSASYRKRLQAC